MNSRHPTGPPSLTETDVVVSDHGSIPEPVREYAREIITRLARRVDRPILHARVRLTQHRDPAIPEPALAQANLDVNGRLIRAQATAPGLVEAIDRLEARLRHQVERVGGGWETRRGRWPSPADEGWRHAQPNEPRPTYYPRPAAEREIVRHKAFGLSRMTVDEAAFDMTALDYGFHLFTEEGTGRDCVLYRDEDGSYRLAWSGELPRPAPPAAIAVEVDPATAPALTQAEAIDRLDLGGSPFVYYVDSADGRGRVLYRRYDGHYGLITPA